MAPGVYWCCHLPVSSIVSHTQRMQMADGTVVLTPWCWTKKIGKLTISCINIVLKVFQNCVEVSGGSSYPLVDLLVAEELQICCLKCCLKCDLKCDLKCALYNLKQVGQNYVCVKSQSVYGKSTSIQM